MKTYFKAGEFDLPESHYKICKEVISPFDQTLMKNK
jgi:hypothetical protein